MYNGRRLIRVLALLLAVLVGLLSFADARRSGGGFGGSRGFRSSPLRRAPSVRAPVQTPRLSSPGNAYRTRKNFFFVPFFGVHPFGFFGSSFGGGALWSLLGLLFNLIALIAVIALVVWLVRRFRRF